MPREGGQKVQSGEPVLGPFAENAIMRGNDPQQAAMLSYLSPEARVRREHPVRLIRAMLSVSGTGTAWRESLDGSRP
jgi:hypothetical protein